MIIVLVDEAHGAGARMLEQLVKSTGLSDAEMIDQETKNLV